MRSDSKVAIILVVVDSVGSPKIKREKLKVLGVAEEEEYIDILLHHY